jgi:hypothetical protein
MSQEVDIDTPECELSVVEEVGRVVEVDSVGSLGSDFLKIAMDDIQGQQHLEMEM